MVSYARGSGPGEQAPDGCSVELYKISPYLDELEPILPLLPDSARVLELGCGTGRMTQVLVDHGLQVTVVDNCLAMLNAVTCDVEKHCVSIDRLSLGARFDAVFLASSLINVPDVTVRSGFLDSIRRHMVAGGFCYIERHDPRMLQAMQSGDLGRMGTLDTRVHDVVRHGNQVHMAVTYSEPRRNWVHEFDTTVLGDQEVVQLLAAHQLAFDCWLDNGRCWFRAALAPVPS